MKIEDFSIAYGDYDKSPANYYLADNNPLRRTIFLALKLGKPLLISGQPGSGKTQLARWAAWYLSQQTDNNISPFLSHPFVFNCKSNSQGRDLFYHYDAISHFQDKEGEKSIQEFINLTAMGQCICQTWGKEAVIEKYALKDLKNIASIQSKAHSSVLLIDEIDKTPKEFANDLLDEIENNKFYIGELNKSIIRSEDRKARILTIMTSNNEKNLPEAFLRRCLYYNIPFPSDEDLIQIIIKRVSPFLKELDNTSRINYSEAYLKLLKFFRHVRDEAIVKPPSTSELLDWIKILHIENLLDLDYKNLNKLNQSQLETLKLSLRTLIKTKEDLEQIEMILNLTNGEQD